MATARQCGTHYSLGAAMRGVCRAQARVLWAPPPHKCGLAAADRVVRRGDLMQLPAEQCLARAGAVRSGVSVPPKCWAAVKLAAGR